MKDFLFAFIKTLIQSLFRGGGSPKNTPPANTNVQPRDTIEEPSPHPREWIERIESTMPKKKEDRF
jgi:hypothetical protein